MHSEASKHFRPIDIIVDEVDTSRRVLEFILLDACLVVDRDLDQTRKSKRHGWRNDDYYWQRTSQRDNRGEKRSVPQEAIDVALGYARSQIHYREQY